ncbi:response regulator transcription factor [Sphingobacterium psychroaquaticum]|uniref:DNA-binding response regulator, OmpR family, contains REC and winged-helix (WHTH) domain n=1 Tax=Sphingobacterium psychroaquaticum TaxID=561061 RepID=A0A1X7K6S0_9SPHI|nr:response regulator transcription factor [Sphingobacterium psychroaquaticum]QBQ42670.1 response regulator transcription factor [Sphingobacterium psychroaquaticum]SMG36385.1 DNA-binding response regulator, OmpR family, contains REC and winged-helix (wHTH) domain [Sphingobacterium psychroaquaticum]
MEILLVEDETAVISLIRRGLNSLGCNISVALNGKTGLAMALSNSYDLIILDVMLPEMSGFEVCRKIRQSNKKVPILILSALDQTEDIVEGFSSDADDYLTKPFNLEELRARVQRYGRKSTSTQRTIDDDLLSIADLTLNTARKTVVRGDKNVVLTATEFRLLEYLLNNKNIVLSRIDILEAVWGIGFNMSTNVVDVYMNYLRKKIDKDHRAKLLHTIVGMGYVLRLPHEN